MSSCSALKPSLNSSTGALLCPAHKNSAETFLKLVDRSTAVSCSQELC